MRKLAREVAFMKIYESLFISNEDDMNDFFVLEKLDKKEDQEFANELVSLYFAHKDDIDAKISENLKDFSLDRIYKIDRAIIALAVSEYFYYKKTPISVIINESVDIAKKYGTDKSYSFVNGILKSILKEDDGR